MDKMVIVGGRRLEGEVRISGAKNAALPIMASTLLVDGWNTFHNIPDLLDIKTIKKLLKSLGVAMEGEGTTLRMNAGQITQCEASYDLVRTMRASILVLGPLVARMGEARVSLPGGCAIGARPVNLHIKALQEMGAEVTLKDGYVEAKASRLKGAEIYFDLSTVTGTENIMMAATLAEGTTILKNAAREPEIVNLAEVLIGMGARIQGAGSDVIDHRRGGAAPSRGGDGDSRSDRGRHLPDRRRDHRRGYPDPRLQPAPSGRPAGQAAGYGDFRSRRTTDSLRVKGGGTLRSVDVKTLPYPGFPDGPAGPDHGAHDRRQRAFRHHRDGLREPVHACQRDDADGGGHRHPGEERHRPGGAQAPRGAGDGDGSAGVGLPDSGGAGGGGGRRSSPASITSTGAISRSRRNCRRWGPISGGCG